LENQIQKKIRAGELPTDADLPLTAPFDAAQAKAAQEAWAKSLGKSSPVEKNSIGMELVLIPPGRFRMGSPKSEEDRHVNEDQVDVTLTKAFYLGKTEVTQGEWEAVMGTTPWKGKENIREGKNYPASFVNWDDATEFCRKLSLKDGVAYRLPTEAEWEYACRGGTTTRYSFGDDESRLGDFAWFEDNSGGNREQYPHAVARKKPNPFGLSDMHGNVYEWCEDAYDDYKLPGGTDPVVSKKDSWRIFRGGGWESSENRLRSADRGYTHIPPETRIYALGFRVARSSGQQAN
jgi:formylglycine-generating enzyme required for sulfatase activity